MTNKIIILANAFSIQMLDTNILNKVSFMPLSVDDVRDTISVAQADNVFINAVGHADTMNILNNMLGTILTANRVNVKLDENTTIIVAQVIGGRLPEGCTSLPEGTQIRFIEVEMLE